MVAYVCGRYHRYKYMRIIYIQTYTFVQTGEAKIVSEAHVYILKRLSTLITTRPYRKQANGL